MVIFARVQQLCHFDAIAYFWAKSMKSVKICTALQRNALTSCPWPLPLLTSWLAVMKIFGLYSILIISIVKFFNCFMTDVVVITWNLLIKAKSMYIKALACIMAHVTLSGPETWSSMQSVLCWSSFESICTTSVISSNIGFYVTQFSHIQFLDTSFACDCMKQ